MKVFAGTATGATVAAYSVGQQIAIGGVQPRRSGFVALVFIFRFRSFREVIAAGRAEHRERERRGRGRARRGAGQRAGSAGATAGPRAPRARA